MGGGWGRGVARAPDAPPPTYASEIIAHHSKIRIAIMRHCYKLLFQDMRDLLYFVIIGQLLASWHVSARMISAKTRKQTRAQTSDTHEIGEVLLRLIAF